VDSARPSSAAHSTRDTAYRCSLNAAQLSAAEFAAFRVCGFDSRLTAGELAQKRTS